MSGQDPIEYSLNSLSKVTILQLPYKESFSLLTNYNGLYKEKQLITKRKGNFIDICNTNLPFYFCC